MVDKVTLTNLANLQNENTAVSAINSNSSAITTAMDNTLSRDGASPNQMQASLDMNANQILNLPYPSSDTSPLRLAELMAGISTTNAATGSSGHTVPFLDGTNTWGGSNTFNLSANFKRGPVYDVKAYGAKGDRVTDDTAAFNAAAAEASTFGGILYVPPGIYLINNTITLTTNIILAGAGRTASYIYTRSDITLVNLTSASQNGMRDLTVFGKGSFSDTGVFGATANCVEMHSSGGHIYDCNIEGGYYPLHIDSTDAVFFNVNVAVGYGPANVLIDGTGQNWYIRCKWDSDNGSGLPILNTRPYPSWAQNTAYSVGNIRINNGYAMQCSVSGTSGLSAPTLKNYGATMSDGTATWVLLCPDVYFGVVLGGHSGENYFLQVDLSGTFVNSVVVDSAAASFGGFPCFGFTNCIFSSDILLQQGTLVNINNCEVSGVLTINAGYNGKFNYSNNIGIGTGASIVISAGISGFVISNNMLNSATIAIAPGTSDHYVIVNNIGVTVVDNGSGTHKTISGNVT